MAQRKDRRSAHCNDGQHLCCVDAKSGQDKVSHSNLEEEHSTHHKHLLVGCVCEDSFPACSVKQARESPHLSFTYGADTSTKPCMRHDGAHTCGSKLGIQLM